MSPLKSLKAALVAVVFATSAVGAAPAWADRDRDHFVGHRGYSGHERPYWGLGLGLLAGTALILATRPSVVYSAPAYSPPVVVQSAPVVISPPPAYAEQNWWYYCNYPAGYYPYVRACQSGWVRVPPTPPGP